MFVFEIDNITTKKTTPDYINFVFKRIDDYRDFSIGAENNSFCCDSRLAIFLFPISDVYAKIFI